MWWIHTQWPPSPSPFSAFKNVDVEDLGGIVGEDI